MSTEHTTGALKNDKADCKVEVDLFPPSAYYAISTVFTYGKHKYDSWNWAKGLAYSRMYGALQRHLNAWFSGQDLDPETGFSHLWHAGCNIAMLIHTEMNVKAKKGDFAVEGLDDRPSLYFTPVIMEQFSSILKENKAFQEIVQKKEPLVIQGGKGTQWNGPFPMTNIEIIQVPKHETTSEWATRVGIEDNTEGRV